MKVIETQDGFDIFWDPDDPVEQAFNSWTDQDFIRVVTEAANKVLAEHTFEDEFMAK